MNIRIPVPTDTVAVVDPATGRLTKAGRDLVNAIVAALVAIGAALP